MGIVFRKRIKTGRSTWLNVSGSGVSASKRVGRLTVNSRGRMSFRIAPGLSFRIGGPSMRYECDVCGLAAMDLPDVVDPELFFECDDGVEHCPTCVPIPTQAQDDCWPGFDR